MEQLIYKFSQAATAVGATVIEATSYQEIASHIGKSLNGNLALPSSVRENTPTLVEKLETAGISAISSDLRSQAATAHGGLTWGEYGLAETGSVLVQSTDEEIRLSSTLPTIHYLLLNRTKIIADAKAATPIMRGIFTGGQPEYVAWITGPSRTADIERVLTIGVHGPKELHILLLPDNITEIQS